MYHQSDGVPQDYAKAVEWYTKAAWQGDATACRVLLGIMRYSQGVGVPQDEAMALELWTKAAEHAEEEEDKMAPRRWGGHCVSNRRVFFERIQGQKKGVREW